MKTIRWGILGLGGIARQFATGLQACPDMELAAVGSRSADKAKAFASEFKAKRAHGSYEALAVDPEVDAIYVATPHPMHKDAAMLCLRAKKAVLCEKPFTLNAKEAEAVIACARRENVFLMEAMWTRFLPVVGQVREWLARKAIGDVRMLTADFGFRAGWNPEGRLLNPQLGGGALLDVGVYTVSFASMLFGGAPSKITGFAHIGDSQVDEQSAMVLAYPRGELALLSCAVRTNSPQEARILGTDGMIHLPGFWHASEATLQVAGKAPETFKSAAVGNGYNYEAMEVARCLRAGLKESPIMALEESLAIMRTLDTLRQQWGLVYAGLE